MFAVRRSALVAARRARAPLAPLAAVRPRALSGKSGFDKREAAGEARYINEHDLDAIKALAAKLHHHASEEGQAASHAALTAIFSKHGVELNDGLEAALVAWKKGDH